MPHYFLISLLRLKRNKFVFLKVKRINNLGKLQISVAESLKWDGVKLDSHDVLIKDAHVWNLLCGHWVCLIDVFDELNGAEYVLQIVGAL